MVAHSTYSLLSLRFQDTHSRPTALFQLLRISGYRLPHPALMWYLLPTLQEAQEVDSTGPSVRNKSETFECKSSSPCSPFTFICSLLCFFQLLQSCCKALLGSV